MSLSLYSYHYFEVLLGCTKPSNQLNRPHRIIEVELNFSLYQSDKLLPWVIPFAYGLLSATLITGNLKFLLRETIPEFY